MQSRPIEVSKTTSPIVQPQELQNRQHGVDLPDEPLPHPFSPGEGREPPQSSASKASFDGHGATQPQEAVENPSRRLSAEKLPRNRSPVDRIVEYERALTSSPKNLSRGPGFKVVPRSKRSGTGTLNLADFPNGIPWTSVPSPDVHMLM